MVSPVGIEPTTNWLKANCSTTELRARSRGGTTYERRADVSTSCYGRKLRRKVRHGVRECHRLPATSLPRCLVVDPDQKFAEILAGIVARHGFDTKIIGEPFDGLRELRAHAYDLILFDLSAHEGDAAFVLDMLRSEMPRVLERTVIVTTNPLVASDVTVGVPVIGKSDLKPLMRYLTL